MSSLPSAETNESGTSNIDQEELEEKPQISRHNEYYMDGGVNGLSVFLVENSLFRVHRYFLDRDSQVFRTMFTCPSPDGGKQGVDDTRPIHLPGVTRREFETLLDHFYKRPEDSREKPEPPAKPAMTPELQRLLVLLKIATFYDMVEVRQFAIDTIQSNFDLETIHKLELANTYDVRQWSESAYHEICSRSTPLTLEEARRLGMKTALLVAQGREAMAQAREEKPPTDESVIGKHFVIGAESALEGIQSKETVIETAFADFQISRSEYAVLAGFNEALMRSGTGHLPEIHVFCSVDIAQRTESLVTRLGKILSPLPGALFTPTSTYRMPVFQKDETLLSWDELVFSRTERYADIRSNVTPTSIQGVSCSQGSWSGGGTSAPSGLSGNELRGGDSEKKDMDDAGNDEGDDEKSGNREGDEGNPDHEDPDDPTDGSLTSSLPAVSFDAQAKVYATTAHTASPKVFQELQVNGRLIVQSFPPRSKPKRLPKSCVEFKKLKFQGRRAIPTRGYEQVHARVVIDSKEELTRVDTIKPSRTPAIGFESTEVTTRQSSSALGFSGSAGLGSPSIKGMFSGHLGAESSSYLETKNYGSRITQGDSYGVVWWGFNVDDPHAQEAGIELLDTLPSAEFQFLGKNASLPARLHVEVVSCWSLISSCENRQSWIQALIGLAKPKGLSYSNLCQIVQLEMPSTLLEDYEFMSLTHVTQSGCHTQVKLEDSHPVHVTPSVVFLNGPVPPDSGILCK